MREEHRRGMRDEDRGPQGPGRPEWGPRPGRGGGGHRGGDWSERGNPTEGWGGRSSRRATRGDGPFGQMGPMGQMGSMGGPGGSMGPMFGRHPFGRGPRARKGDVRAAILDLLAEGGQWNGYQLIQEIAGRTSGVWRPSAGSVYPALQQLEDEELIAPEGEGRRRMYALTDKGREYAEQHADELNGSWDAVSGMTDDDAVELSNMIRQVMMAVMEVRRAGSPDQLAQARAVLAQARRSMYRILADDQPADTSAAAPADDTAVNDTAVNDTAVNDTPESAE
jgi:DNA-binding PadR family transcriptional regulator